jgi:hypothetical protein
MTKRKQDHIGDPWEIQIAYWTAKGSDPDKARIATTVLWMYHGDLRPLRAAIAQSVTVQSPVRDEAILGCLAMLIDEGRLIVKPLGRNRPKSPDKFPRDLAAAYLYEEEVSTNKTSEEAFNIVAQKFGVSEDTVRKAVTQFRKSGK